MIRKTTKRPSTAAAPMRTINAGTNITAGAIKRQTRPAVASTAKRVNITASQSLFARQLGANIRRNVSINAATNTSNIAAKPAFLELLPLFTQKLIIEDIVGSVPMASRQQLIPYFKVVTENTKGETAKGTILSSPFVNRQGKDPNFAGRIVKNEAVAASTLAYIPVLPGTVTLAVTAADDTVTKLIDDGAGNLVDSTGASAGTINYADGTISGVTGTIAATYQYDNETVGPDADGNYGAKMGKVYLQLDEINLVATAHELACYWSVYSAFAAQQEYGGNIADMSKEAAISEITAEINTTCLDKMAAIATYAPQFNWDASPILSGAVVPSDYLNMFKLKLSQAAAAIYQATNLARPNRLVVGTNVGAFIKQIAGFQAATVGDEVGPYKLGTLDEFEVYVNPFSDTNKWVMSCKSNDIRRNSALMGMYLPIGVTDPIGLANASVQQGAYSMYAFEPVNPNTIVSGKVLGTF